MTAADIAQMKSLEGVRVLIVEDETLVAMLLEDYLTELRCEIAFSARRVNPALAAIEAGSVDAAILDLNVAGEDITPLVELLTAKSIPFVFASGYGSKGLNAGWAHHPMLQKPFDLKQLEQALLKATGRDKLST